MARQGLYQWCGFDDEKLTVHSLVSRLMGAPPPENPLSTVGASFVTRRLIDVDSNTVVRLQIWDTAGQERFVSRYRVHPGSESDCMAA